MKDKDLKKAKGELSFEEKYKSYKSGESEAPIIHKTFSFKVNDTEKLVILSSEDLDSDGEVIDMDGGRIRNKSNGIPMIDSHDSWSSVTQKGLGAFRNPRFTKIDNEKVLVGEPDFAPTPNGDIARILYMGVNGGKPYFTDVSVGIAVYDYNNETKHITEWEVFECSLVTAGSNRKAVFTDKSLKDDDGDIQIAKDLARFKQINPAFKEFTKTFLSDSFCEIIGYKKDGNMLVDIANLYDIVINKIQVKEAPTPAQEDPEETEETLQVSTKDLEKVMMDTFLKRLGNKS